jgi:ABC-type sugar transport system substrate-binding protein
MAKYVASRWDRKAIVLLLDGPLDSEPARVRLAIFQEILDDTSGLLSLGHAESFSEMAAYHVAAAAIREPQRPGILVCANDSMAIGAARAVSEAELSKCIQVFGYDGIPRALHAIAEPSNPLQATIRIPPSQYGIEIAAQIVADNEASRLRRPRVESKMIPITASNLVTIHNAEEVISD